MAQVSPVQASFALVIMIMILIIIVAYFCFGKLFCCCPETPVSTRENTILRDTSNGNLSIIPDDFFQRNRQKTPDLPPDYDSLFGITTNEGPPHYSSLDVSTDVSALDNSQQGSKIFGDIPMIIVTEPQDAKNFPQNSEQNPHSGKVQDDIATPPDD